MKKEITPYLLYEAKDAGKNEAEIIIAFPDLRANFGRVSCGILECTESGLCFRSTDEISLDYLNASCRKILPSTYEKWWSFIRRYLVDMDEQNGNALEFKRMYRIQYATLRTRAWGTWMPV